MNTQQVAEILSLSDRRTVRSLIEQGKLKAKVVMVGNKKKYDIDEESVNEYLKYRRKKLERRKKKLKTMSKPVEKVEVVKKVKKPNLIDYFEALIIETITRIFK